MNDLISRQALCKYALNQKDKSVTPNDIMRFPAAQPKRMRGHWRVTPMACYGGGTLTEYECSECEGHQIVVSNFCPNCGADMTGGKQDGFN